MAFGLKVWDASGDLVVDTTSRLPRLVHSQYISRSAAAGSVEIPAVADKQAFVIVSTANVTYWDGSIRNCLIAPATVSLVLTTLSWTPVWTPSGADTLVFVFIYD